MDMAANGTIKQFLADTKISMMAEWSDRNPQISDDDWARTATHYKCAFRYGRRRMTVYFSMGSARTEEPTAVEVLDCIALDASGIENAITGFEDWASEYGYDTDSRKAERIYRSCKIQARKLQSFLGITLYQRLLFGTERG